MNRRRAAVLASLCTVLLAVAAAPVGAVVTFDMRIWMMPPMDVTTAGSCLTNGWHADNNRALDWNHNCGYGSSANVYFRTRTLDADGPPALINWAEGEPYQISNIPCNTGFLRQAKVRVRSTWDNLVKGQMLYAHSQISRTTSFDILFPGGRGGTYWDDSYYNSIDIADTKVDSGGVNCWTALHAHENNVVSSGWDAFNTAKWNGALTGVSYDNDYVGNWTRSLHWVDD